MARSLRSRTAKQQKEKDQEVEKEKMDLTRSRSIKPVHSNKEVKRARGRKKKSVETVSQVTTTSSAVPSVAVEQPPPPAKNGLQSVLVDVKENTTSLSDKEQTSVPSVAVEQPPPPAKNGLQSVLVDVKENTTSLPDKEQTSVKRARGRKKKSVETVSHVTTTSSAVPSVAVEQPPPPAKSGLQSVLVDVKGNTTSLPDKEQTSVKRARGRKKKSVETVSHVTTTSSAVPSVAVEQPPPPAKNGLQSVLVDVKENTTSLPDKEQTSVVARKEAPGNLAMSSDEGLSDDSDADPMWTPSAGTHKGSESLKSFVTGASLFKKDKKKLFRKNVLSPSSRKRTRKVVDATKTDPVVLNIKEFVSKKVKLMMANADTKPDKKGDSFLLLKADIGKEKPSLWRVDREMNCLQRFDPCEMEGNELHRNTDTYSLWNDALKKDYVRANVRTLVHHRKEYVVQYLDLQTSPESFEGPSSSEMTTTNPLRENFIVFLQTLISQVLDTSFLSEITNENDEYFLRDIREIEKVTDDKKKLLVKNTWDPELRKCADIYPCLNIVAHMRNEYLKCQVCSVTSSQKLLKFYGQPYNWTTLSPNKCPSSIKTQFHVCARCSNIVSLYNRVHHQKYNFFIKCHSKVNQMKSDNEAFENQVLLKHCLEDSSWVNLLFAELESIWKECEENS